MPDLDPPRPSRLRRFLFLLLILAVLCGAAYASYWAYGKLKGRQSRHLTKMAMEYLQQNKVAEAEMSLETAIRLKPNNAEALRVLARLQWVTDRGAQSLETWQKLAASGGITLDDLAQFSMAASREGDQALAERLANAAAAGGNTVFKHMLRANLLLSKNDIPGAESEFRQAVEVDTTGNSRAMLARFLLTRRLNAETAPEIREMLSELSKRPDAVGLEALSSCLTLSFAHLRKGDPALALKTIESFGADVDLGSLAPQQKLIIASVFSANGRRDDARHVASLISLEQLSQQESAFLQTALANPESLSQREPTKRKDQPRKK